jgi:hypothetical protein
MEVPKVAELRVGAGKREIQIPRDYLAVENFKEIHDPIHARVIVIEQEETVAIVSMELTSLPEPEVREIQNKISEKTGISPKNIWVCMTHSFSSPHLLPDFMLKTEENIALKKEYDMALQTAACEAAQEAVGRLVPAQMGIQTGTCDIVANRDIKLEDGWWIGTNGVGLTDKTVSVIRFNDLEGNLIAVISHFAMQSSVLDQSELSDGGKPVSSDVAGNACAKVEAHYGDPVVALFLIGAAGDQAPVEKAVNEAFVSGKRVRTDLHEGGFEICERLSEKLKNSICMITDQTVCEQQEMSVELCSVRVMVPAKKMEKDLHSLVPTREFPYEPDGEKETTIEGMRIGNVALLGFRPELNCTTAISIMAMSDFKMTLVCTMVNGASKYMADETSYDRCSYEAMNSPWGRGAAEIVRDRAIALLQEMNQEEKVKIEWGENND